MTLRDSAVRRSSRSGIGVRQSPPGLRGNLAISASQGVALAIGALGTFLLARVLGPNGRGGLSLLQAISALVATLCLFGTPTLIVRRRLLGSVRGIVVPAVLATVAVGFFVSLLIALGYLWTSPTTLQQGGVTTVALVAAAVNSALLVGREGFAAHLQAEQRFHRLAVWRIVWAATPLAAIVMALPWGVGTSSVYLAIVVANVAVTLALAPVLWRLFERAGKVYRRFRVAPRDLLSEHLRLWGVASAHPDVRAALGSHVALTLLLLVYRVDVLILGVLSTATAVGLYSIAYVLAELPWLIVNGYAVTLLPRLVGEGPRESEALYRRALLHSIGWALLIVACIALVGQPVLELALGSSFRGSYTTFLLLAPGVLAFIPFKLLATRLIAAGAPWRLAQVCLALVGVNLVLNVLLDHRFGAQGSAAAASTTYMLAALFYIPLGRQSAAIEGRP